MCGVQIVQQRINCLDSGFCQHVTYWSHWMLNSTISTISSYLSLVSLVSRFHRLRFSGLLFPNELNANETFRDKEMKKEDDDGKKERRKNGQKKDKTTAEEHWIGIGKRSHKIVWNNCVFLLCYCKAAAMAMTTTSTFHGFKSMFNVCTKYFSRSSLHFDFFGYFIVTIIGSKRWSNNGWARLSILADWSK